MPSNKEHHYVPQFYLRNFANPGENRVRAFNIARKLHIPTASIPGQCHKAYLYGKDQSLERMLSELEREVAPIFRSIIERRLSGFSGMDLLNVYMFFALQMGRTPAAAAEINLMSSKLMRSVMRAHPDPPPGLLDELDGVSINHPDAILMAVQRSVQSVRVLADLKLSVIENQTNAKFITSDTPAVLHNQWSQDVGDIGVVGYACSGLQIFLPISPEFLLVLYDSSVYTFRGDDRTCARVSDIRFVKQMNALQACEAVSSVYYRDKSTAAAIDRLPWESRRLPSDSVMAATFREEGSGERSLIVTHRRISPIKLAPYFITVRPHLASVPLPKRAMSWRPRAMEEAERLGPPRTPPDVPNGTSFSRVSQE